MFFRRCFALPCFTLDARPSGNPLLPTLAVQLCASRRGGEALGGVTRQKGPLQDLFKLWLRSRTVDRNTTKHYQRRQAWDRSNRVNLKENLDQPEVIKPQSDVGPALLRLTEIDLQWREEQGDVEPLVSFCVVKVNFMTQSQATQTVEVACAKAPAMTSLHFILRILNENFLSNSGLQDAGELKALLRPGFPKVFKERKSSDLEANHPNGLYFSSISW